MHSGTDPFVFKSLSTPSEELQKRIKWGIKKRGPLFFKWLTPLGGSSRTQGTDSYRCKGTNNYSI